MITLTIPHNVNSVLGGDVPVAYNKLVLGPFSMDPVAMAVTAAVRLSSTVNPNMQVILGTLTILTQTAILEIAVERLDFYRRVQLTGPQNTSVGNIIQNAQNALENGLVSLGVVAGTQSLGA